MYMRSLAISQLQKLHHNDFPDQDHDSTTHLMATKKAKHNLIKYIDVNVFKQTSHLSIIYAGGIYRSICSRTIKCVCACTDRQS